MNILQPKFIPILPQDINNPLEHIENVGRTCYKSNSKGEPEKFFRTLATRGHFSVTEHYRFLVSIPEYVYRPIRVAIGNSDYVQMTRKRDLMSFSLRGIIEMIRQENTLSELTIKIQRYLAHILRETLAFYGINYYDILPKSIGDYIYCLLSEFDKLNKCFRIKVLEWNDNTFKMLSPRELLIHYWFTVRFICDRGISHELVRHRTASFSQESSRYCNYSTDRFNNQVSFIDIGTCIDYKSLDNYGLVMQEWINACEDAEKHYLRMLELGATTDFARSVLPNSTKTEICVTANLEEWKHIFGLRTELTAHPQMRELIIPLSEWVEKDTPLQVANLFKELSKNGYR